MTTAALSWFARHEIRLAWREWLAIMTGGRRGRRRAVIIGLLVFGALLHVPAYAVIGKYATLESPLDKSAPIVVTATIFLAWSLMLSRTCLIWSWASLLAFGSRFADYSTNLPPHEWSSAGRPLRLNTPSE